MPTSDDERPDRGAEVHDACGLCPEGFEAVLVELFGSLPRATREEMIPLDDCFAALGVDVATDDGDDDPVAPMPG